MNLDRWRGKAGLLGWLVWKWDTRQIKREIRRVMKNQMSNEWRKEQIYRDGTTKKDEPL